MIWMLIICHSEIVFLCSPSWPRTEDHSASGSRVFGTWMALSGISLLVYCHPGPEPEQSHLCLNISDDTTRPPNCLSRALGANEEQVKELKFKTCEGFKDFLLVSSLSSVLLLALQWR